MKNVYWCGKLAQFAVGASLALGCVSIIRAAAGDWPQWRGPHRDAVSSETGLLQDWPTEGPKLAWKATGMGVGYSTVSIADGKIFTMGDHGDVADVMALDMDGKTLWTTKIGKSGGSTAPGTRSTPTVDGDRVYAMGQFGDLVCLEAGTGKEVWHKDLRKELSGEMGGWGYAESPLVDGDKLICTPGGKQGTVAAFDKKTGDVIWRSKDMTDGAQYSSLMMADINGTHQYVVFTGKSVAGIAADGKVLWKAQRKGKTAMVPTPVVDGNMVFVTSGYGVGCNMFKITGSGADSKAEEVYANKDMQIHHGGVICLEDHVYGATDGGDLVCMNIKDGSVAWKNKCVGKGSIAYADGRFYVRAEGSGDVALVEATDSGYKEHGRMKQPERGREKAWAHPVVAGGKLYLRDMNNLFCYDVKAK
ncbi:MAG TPA: PQQ-binding-like beta-propeller repeat protein [Tepidisphaeraceae bacterium]|jgi:outer membrane protein assembly factor BamB|nr:PQQ-binding-like beta-propeller repeat protein [Tepidisphaeraceae bacterium]